MSARIAAGIGAAGAVAIVIAFGLVVGCAGLERKPYRNDPLLQSRPPESGGRIPPQNIAVSQREPLPPTRP